MSMKSTPTDLRKIADALDTVATLTFPVGRIRIGDHVLHLASSPVASQQDKPRYTVVGINHDPQTRSGDDRS